MHNTDNAYNGPLPAGCDQQGRYATRPMAAEAYADVGADDDVSPPATRLGLLLVMLPWLLAIAGWAVVVALRN